MSTTGSIFSGFNNGIFESQYQASYSYYLSTTQTNVTGDGTVYTIIADTEIFDQSLNNFYNLGYDNTGTFTAPVGGVHHFKCCLCLGNIAADHTTGEVQLVVTEAPSSGDGNQVFSIWRGNPAAMMRSGTNDLIIWAHGYVSLGQGDTVQTTLSVNSATSGAIISLMGGNPLAGTGLTYVSGSITF